MSLENLTTASSFYTEKVLGDIQNVTISNTGNSGVNSTSGFWQIANVTSDSFPIYPSLSSAPLIRAVWSADGGNTWYDSATQIAYAYTLSTPGGPQIMPGLAYGCTIGADTSNVYIRTGNGTHGTVTMNASFQATWTGTPVTFMVRYVLLQPSSNLNISSSKTIPANKVIKTGTVNFSGTVTNATNITQTIPMDYIPNFFAIEFDVKNHVYDSTNSYGIPNNTWTHSNGIGYQITGQLQNTVFVSGGITSTGLVITASVSNGSTGSTTTNFDVAYRVIDLSINQSVESTDVSKYALINRVNSPTRQSNLIKTAVADGANTYSTFTKDFAGAPFIDHYFDCNNDGVYWRNSYRQDAQSRSTTFGFDTYPIAAVYLDSQNIYGFWIAGYSGSVVSPTGRTLRYIEYGDYSV